MKKSIQSSTIVFIHGLFLNSKSWSKWQLFFESKGYITYAPDYPGRNVNPETLWKSVTERFGQVTFTDVLSYYEQFIKSLPEKPIVIGHSMGGLIAQKLVEKDLVAAAIPVSSAPPQGVFTTKLSFAKSNLGLLNPLKGNSVHFPNKKWFHYAFTNTLSREESDIFFDQFVVPESRNIPRETLTKAGKINFRKQHVPMLFLSASEDHIIPASLNVSNVKRYKDKQSVRAHKIFKNRDHFMLVSDNWQDIATYISNWIDQHGSDDQKHTASVSESGTLNSADLKISAN